MMQRSNSKAEDAARDEASSNRVTRVHGGELVEAVSNEDLELMNEPECKHDNLIRDEAETEFNAFVCANSKCGVVVLFEKNKM